MSETLYRKYRPQNFEAVVGQDPIKQTLQNAIKLGRVAHAYLFCGPRGTGKTSLARILAKAINCLAIDQKTGNPCGKCEICLAIAEDRLMDLIEIDAASNRGIGEIRDLKEKIRFLPTHARAKVYIIDEVHMLTKDAFNALLKTLEEPPPHVYFILATTEAHKIPPTIISRCQRFDFRRASEAEQLQNLKRITEQEQIKWDTETTLEIIAQVSEGSFRDAVSLLDKLHSGGKITQQGVQDQLGLLNREAFVETWRCLIEKKPKQAVDLINQFYYQGTDLTQFTKELIGFLREKLLEAVESNALTETTALLKVIQLFEKAYRELKTASIPQLPLETAILEACQNTFNFKEDKKDSGSIFRKKEEVKEIREVKAAVVAVNPEEVKLLSLENFQKHWESVLNQLTPASVKLILKEASLLGFKERVLLVGIKNNFLLEKVYGAEQLQQLEQAIEKVFGVPIQVKYELIKMEILSQEEIPTHRESSALTKEDVQQIFQ